MSTGLKKPKEVKKELPKKKTVALAETTKALLKEIEERQTTDSNNE